MREIFDEIESTKALKDALASLYAKSNAKNDLATSLVIVLYRVNLFGLSYPKHIDLDLTLDALPKLIKWTWRQLRPGDSCQFVSRYGFQVCVPALLLLL